MTTAPSRFWLSSITGLAVVGVSAGGVMLARAHAADPAAPTLRAAGYVSPAVTVTRSPSGATPTTEPQDVAESSGFRSGEYSATGHYLTPGGDESIGVTIVLAHGMVTDAAVRAEALSPTALQFQIQFESQIRVAVIGRDLAGLSVDRVAGASLTSVGFNDALVAIQTEASNA